MTYCSPESIFAVFDVLDQSGREWLLLRNTDEELPHRLRAGKDIDVLVRYPDRDAVRQALKRHDYERLAHPLRKDVKLYGVHEFEMYRASGGVLLDINFEIAVRSLDRGQWIPLDQAIQESAWRNKAVANLGARTVPVLGPEDLFVATVARCVFDRRDFSRWHSDLLARLLQSCDEAELFRRLRLIFFKYTDQLMAHISKKCFGGIVADYLSFSDY